MGATAQCSRTDFLLIHFLFVHTLPLAYSFSVFYLLASGVWTRKWWKKIYACAPTWRSRSRASVQGQPFPVSFLFIGRTISSYIFICLWVYGQYKREKKGKGKVSPWLNEFTGNWTAAGPNVSGVAVQCKLIHLFSSSFFSGPDHYSLVIAGPVKKKE
jgi:hypothetical protein